MSLQTSSKLIAWWLTIRPKTLMASVGPILLGTALAAGTASIDLHTFSYILACSLMLQISVNIANDFFDAKSGVDSELRIGPIRASQAGLLTTKEIRVGLTVSSLLAIALGLYLVTIGGWLFLLLGFLSLVGVFAYSAGPFPLASHGLGEVAVLVFFGWIAVLGSCYLQSNYVSIEAFWLATCSGLFASAVMLINNLRDIPTDTAASKITLAVRLGDHKTRILFSLIIASIFIIHSFMSVQLNLKLFIPLGICLLPCCFLIKQIFSCQGTQLNRLLAQVVAVGFLYHLSTALTLVAVFAQ